MKTFKTDDAILEFGIFKESQANKFYLALAERVSDPAISKVLELLANEELEHKAKLELELMKLGRSVDTSPGTEDFDASDYICSTAAELDVDFNDVLSLAVAKEDAAFRLYVDMIAQVQNEDAREVLVQMAQEEMRHKIRFEKERDRLLERKEDRDH